jgi:hypothetical protein
VPKPKHMDSQIDFVAIRGTPDQETQDSQLITEHQKEIREEQAQVGAWFAQLASKKPRRRSKTDTETTGSKKPSNDIINTPIDSQRGAQHDMVPETTAKKMGGASGVMASFISESIVGSPVRSRGPSIVRSIDERQEDPQLEEKASSDLSEIDAVRDQPMLDAPSSAPDMKTAHEIQILEPVFNDPSGEDTFADAPDFPSSRDEEKPPPIATNFGTRFGDVPPPRDIADIVDEISPSKNNVEYEDPGIASDTSVPPVTATPSKNSQKWNGKKRKRTSEKAANITPEVLDTIVIAKELSSQPPHPQSIEKERPAKRRRSQRTTISPMFTRSMRSSAKKAPPKKPESRSKASSRTTCLDQPIRKHILMSQH